MAEDPKNKDAAETTAAPVLDRKLLQGLKYRSSEKRKVKDGDKEVTKWVPTERALRAEDVLSWVDKGETVVIVTGDGQKYVVEKNPAAGK